MMIWNYIFINSDTPQMVFVFIKKLYNWNAINLYFTANECFCYGGYGKLLSVFFVDGFTDLELTTFDAFKQTFVESISAKTLLQQTKCLRWIFVDSIKPFTSIFVHLNSMNSDVGC